jgi:glyoxylase-like metal-dependent hydrolase (beta-lactamase superfamily II)
VAELAQATGAPVYMADDERLLLEDVNSFTPPGVELQPYSPDVALQGDEVLELAGMSFETLRVPGHSPAHLAFYTEGAVFSGDLLFAGSVGRTDLPGADWDTLVESIRSLADRYPRDTIVYSGHGPETTIGAELDRNPFLAELRA